MSAGLPVRNNKRPRSTPPGRIVLFIIVWAALAVGQLDQTALAAPGLTLTPDVPSGQPVGTMVIWTAVSSNTDPTDYRLSVKSPGGTLRVMYDYAPDTIFEWTPIEDGVHALVVSARNLTTGDIAHTTQLFAVQPIASTAPVVTPTAHPLVALFSTPPCQTGEVRVVYRRATGGPLHATPPRPCRASRTNNFYVAGMTANSTYLMFHQRLVGGSVVETGSPIPHTTGAIPAAVQLGLPNAVVLDPAGPSTSRETILLQSAIRAGSDANNRFPFATDLAGNVIWYSDRAIANDAMLLRPSGQGTMLMVMSGPNGVGDQILREIDLAGHVVRQTNVTRATEQLAAMGMPDAITSFHHEARRLPNGHTAVIGSLERIMTDVQGPGPVDVMADAIIVLDENWQVVWSWSGFDHLDPTRVAVLGETCINEGPGCPPIVLDDIANDWMHSNAIAYSADGNFLLSMRHQDWVIKIDYRDGAGDGHIIWRLGPDGDFSLASGDPFPWFSHQHDPNFSGANLLAVYDNGNTRCAQIAGCVSRGQVYELDETAMTATLVLNADLGNYSAALGSAQPLLNGNYHFDSGFQHPPLMSSWSDEVSPDGLKEYSLELGSAVYRSFRLWSMYVFRAP